MKLRAIVVMMVAALASSAAWADPGRWASPLAPLQGGHVELVAGLGAGVAAVLPAPFGASPFPGGVLGARWGITDSVQLALPLLATVSTEIGDGWPRLSMTGGVASVGVGVSSLGWRTFFQPSVAAGAHWIGKRLSVVVSADTTMLVVLPASAVSSSRLGGHGGVALRLDDAWSVGASAGMAATALSFGAEQTQTTSALLGADGSDPVAGVPTVRWLVTEALSLELWTYLVLSSTTTTTASRHGLSTAGANLSLTWRL